jgi:hypothetical protein
VKGKRKCPSVFDAHALLPLVLCTLFWAFGIIFPQSYAFEGQSSQCKEMKIGPAQMAQSPKTGQRGNTSNPATNVVDNNFSSVWSNKGNPAEWIKVDLGQQKVLCYLDISWTQGARRTNDFEIFILTHSDTTQQSANDDILWHSGSSSGIESTSRTAFERVEIDDVVARFLKIAVYGNQWNDWAAIKELRVHGYDLPEGDNSRFLIATLRTHVEDQQGLLGLYSEYLEIPSDISLSKPDDSNLGYTMQLAGQHGVSYFSVEEIEQNAERLKLSGIDVIEYNLEESYSPSSDLRDPVGAVREAYDIAHKNGLKLILTPSMDLTNAHASEFAQSTDYYNIMALELQSAGQYAVFHDHVVSAVEKIREQSPDLIVTAELTTVRGSLEDMKRNCAAALPHVDGYSIWYSNDTDGLGKLERFLDWFDGIRGPLEA